jgi:hypothetical protein
MNIGNIMDKQKQIIEILHTIFCRRQHEDNMILYDSSTRCCYYLEQSIEDTWNLRDHLMWREQAEFFMKLSKGKGLEMLAHITTIYKAAQCLKDENPLYMKYVELLVKGD